MNFSSAFARYERAAETGRALKEKFTLSVIYLIGNRNRRTLNFHRYGSVSQIGLSRAISAAYAGRLYRT